MGFRRRGGDLMQEDFIGRFLLVVHDHFQGH